MTILVGYFPSPQGQAALGLAISEATAHGTDLLVLNVVQREAILERGRLQEDAALSLTDTLRATGVPFELRREESQDAAKTIVDVARSVGADLIVLGLRRRSAAGKLLFGSTAQRILMDADVPVLTVRAPG